MMETGGRIESVARAASIHAGWQRARFIDVAEVVTGSTPPTSRPDYYCGEIPFVGPADLGDAAPIVTAQKSLSPSGALEARLLPRGAVLVCCIGATIGKVGIAGVPLATNQQINALIFDEARIEPRYGFHFCRTLEALLRHRGASTTLPILSKGKFQEIEITFPPLAEQRRIADVLDKADAIRRKRKQSITLTDTLLRSTFLDLFGDPITNPKGWPVKPLGDLADVASGVAKGKTYGLQTTITLPYMRVANVQDGHLALDDIKTITVSETEAARYRLESGDVLLTEGGDPDKLGRGAVWRGEIPDCIHQNHIFRVRPHALLLAEYLSALLGSMHGKQYFLRAAKQTTGIATINMTQLKGFPVLVPPEDIQHRYRAAIEATRGLGGRQEDARHLHDQAFLSLVRSAFAGEL